MKSVLLVNPPHNGFLRSEPTGLLVLAAILRDGGHQVHLYDCVVESEGEAGLGSIVKRLSPDIIGITCITWTATSAYRLGRELKNTFSSSTLIYGGPHPSLKPSEPFLKGSADLVVRGEAEDIILPVVNGHCDNNKVIHTINQASIVEGDSTWAEMQPSLEGRPLPAYDLVPYSRYNSSIHLPPYAEKQAAHVLATRGCPHNCYFCASPSLYARKIRRRSPSSIASEITYLRSQYGIRYVHFVDDDLLLSPSYALDVANEIHQTVPDLLWICQARVDSVLRAKSILSTLYQTGCIGIEIGIEAAQDTALFGMGKGISTQDSFVATRYLKESNIQPIYLTLSYAPGETTDGPFQLFRLISTIETSSPWNSLSEISNISTPVIYGHLMTPMPGSSFWSNAESFGRVLLRDYDDAYTERINFLPQTLLDDEPARRVESLCLSRFSCLLDFCLDRNLYISESIFLDNDIAKDSYKSIAVDVFSGIDGKGNTSEIAQKVLGDTSSRSLSLIASIVCVLSAGGYIKSAKTNDSNAMQ